MSATFLYERPAPAIRSVLPSAGPLTGGTAITISGRAFVDGATVTVGGTPATGVSVSSDGELTALTAAHAAGAVDVTVTNPDGALTTLPGGFTYEAVPPDHAFRYRT